jgi:hypothetical protein
MCLSAYSASLPYLWTVINPEGGSTLGFLDPNRAHAGASLLPPRPSLPAARGRLAPLAAAAAATPDGALSDLESMIGFKCVLAACPGLGTYSPNTLRTGQTRTPVPHSIASCSHPHFPLPLFSPYSLCYTVPQYCCSCFSESFSQALSLFSM